MYDEILVPTDGSEGVDVALDHALDLARSHEATVHGLYVVDRRLYFAADDSDRETVRERLEREGATAVDHVRDRSESFDLDCVTEVREGYPDRDIVEYADEQDIDVIVMGTHGRTGRERLAHLGSVTERVVENAGCPVFVIHVE